MHTQLAIVDGHVVGFTDLNERGLPKLTTFASLTSRPVFERQGFMITGARYFGEGDTAAKTYEMGRVLDDATHST